MLKALTATSVILLTLSNIASAYSLVSSTKTSGTVTAINAAQKTVTVQAQDGSTSVVAFSDEGTLTTNRGQKFTLDTLKVGSNVVLKKQVNVAVPSGQIKGQVLAVNSSNSTVKILEDGSQNVLNVKLDDKVAISGKGVESLQDLQRGSELIVRSTAR